MAAGGRRSSMRIRKVALAAVAALLGGGALAFPTVARAALPPFPCGTQTGGIDINGNPTNVSAVRIGRHDSESPAYDRFVVEFSNGPVPKWTAIPKSSANFWLQPSNQPGKLAGTPGLTR